MRRFLLVVGLALAACTAPPPTPAPPTPPPNNSGYPVLIAQAPDPYPPPPTPTPFNYPLDAVPPTAAPVTFTDTVPFWGYRVVNTLPHDTSAFTQGLLFTRTASHPQGVFYESTGLYGRSSLRLVEPSTGAVLSQTALPAEVFGEGLALVDTTLWQVTWREGVAYTYDVNTLARTSQVTYTTQGWGLAFDGTSLWMTDGSNTLYRRDPRTFAVLDTRPVLDGLGRPVTALNELEWVAGELWANIWQTDRVARIDPASGRVRSWLDLSGLLTAEQRATADVLNGLAYDPRTERLWVTGKLWPSVFEIELLPR